MVLPKATQQTGGGSRTNCKEFSFNGILLNECSQWIRYLFTLYLVLYQNWPLWQQAPLQSKWNFINTPQHPILENICLHLTQAVFALTRFRLCRNFMTCFNIDREIQILYRLHQQTRGLTCYTNMDANQRHAWVQTGSVLVVFMSANNRQLFDLWLVMFALTPQWQAQHRAHTSTLVSISTRATNTRATTVVQEHSSPIPIPHPWPGARRATIEPAW